MINVTEKLGPVTGLQLFHFWSKIEILVKNRNIAEKSKFWSKTGIWAKHPNLGQ